MYGSVLGVELELCEERAGGEDVEPEGSYKRPDTVRPKTATLTLANSESLPCLDLARHLFDTTELGETKLPLFNEMCVAMTRWYEGLLCE